MQMGRKNKSVTESQLFFFCCSDFDLTIIEHTYHKDASHDISRVAGSSQPK